MDNSCIRKEYKICARLLGAMASESRSGKRLLVKNALFTHPLAEESLIIKAHLPNTHSALILFNDIPANPDKVRTRDCCGNMEAVHSPCTNMKISAIGKGADGKWVPIDLHPESVGVFSLELWKDGIGLHTNVISRALGEELKQNPDLLKLTRCAKFSAVEIPLAAFAVAAGAASAGMLPALANPSPNPYIGIPVMAMGALYFVKKIKDYIRQTKVARTVKSFEKFACELKSEAGKFFERRERAGKEYF